MNLLRGFRARKKIPPFSKRKKGREYSYLFILRRNYSVGKVLLEPLQIAMF